MAEIKDLMWRTLKKIHCNHDYYEMGDQVTITGDIETISFETTDGGVLRMYHSQDCCESVLVDEIHGDLEDLIGEPILQAEEEVHSVDELERDFPDDGFDYMKHELDESFTWTFYKLGTIKGSVTIRWYGTSNGYYSESVDCCWDKRPKTKNPKRPKIRNKPSSRGRKLMIH